MKQLDQTLVISLHSKNFLRWLNRIISFCCPFCNRLELLRYYATFLNEGKKQRQRNFPNSFWLRTDNGFRIPNFLAHQVATPIPISLATEVINFVFVAARSRRDRLRHKLDMLGWSKLSTIVIRSVVVTADAILDILPTSAIRWFHFKRGKIRILVKQK